MTITRAEIEELRRRVAEAHERERAGIVGSITVRLRLAERLLDAAEDQAHRLAWDEVERAAEGLRRQVRELEAEIGNEHAEWLDRQAEIEQLRSENAELRAALDAQAEQGPVQENGATHVDDWIGNYRNRESYARWWLHHARLPAALQLAFAPVMREFRLFCTWQGKRYRVTGASRFGDVWLAENPSREHGYDHRVNVDECSAWGREP